MSSHVTQMSFKCDALRPTPGELDPESDEHINDGMFASMLADRIEPVLHNYEAATFDRVVEDHGVHFYSKSGPPFTLHVVCTNLGDDEHLVFVEPAQKRVRPFPWLKSHETEQAVLPLVTLLNNHLSAMNDVSELRLVPHDQPL